jgi:hypothetical protein
MRAVRMLRGVLKVLGLSALVCAAALIATRGRHSLPPPTVPPDTSHASWRGVDSGYQHPASRKSEDTHAQ